MRKFSILLGFVLFGMLNAQGKDARDPWCVGALKPENSSEEIVKATDVRKVLIEKFKGEKNFPAFLKDTPAGSISVLEVNTKTYKNPVVNEFLENSIGIQVYLQPGWTNDHGSFRLMDQIIDVDTPGARNFGEFHETGIAWRGLGDYLERRDKDSAVILEVAYRVTLEEQKIAILYQRMRRAGIIRVPFTFGGESPKEGLNNLLKSGEHCFLFCNGTRLDSQVMELRAQVKSFGIQDLDAFLARSDVNRFINQANSALIMAPMIEEKLYPEMLGDVKTRPYFFQKLKSEGISILPQDQVYFLNWVYGLWISEQYSKLFKSLQISGSIGVGDAAHARATAILIYELLSKEKSFENASYQARGKFTSWDAVGVHPFKKNEDVKNVEPKNP